MLRNNIGLVWRKIYTSKQRQFEDVCNHHPIVTRSSLSCLLAFYGILYTFSCVHHIDGNYIQTPLLPSAAHT